MRSREIRRRHLADPDTVVDNYRDGWAEQLNAQGRPWGRGPRAKAEAEVQRRGAANTIVGHQMRSARAAGAMLPGSSLRHVI